MIFKPKFTYRIRLWQPLNTEYNLLQEIQASDLKRSESGRCYKLAYNKLINLCDFFRCSLEHPILICLWKGVTF